MKVPFTSAGFEREFPSSALWPTLQERGATRGAGTWQVTGTATPRVEPETRDHEMSSDGR
jgi:hypothetical protein